MASAALIQWVMFVHIQEHKVLFSLGPSQVLWKECCSLFFSIFPNSLFIYIYAGKVINIAK